MGRLFVIALLALLAGCPAGDPKLPLTAMTFNVMCSFCVEPEQDAWDDRIDPLLDVMRRHDPDLLGLQEFTFASEVDLFVDELEDYDPLFFETTDPAAPLSAYPDATILYRRDRFEVMESGTYWLSPEPDVAWSSGFATNQIWRVLTWAHLRDLQRNEDLYFATTHVDNNSPSQEMSAPLILERTAPFALEMPVLVVGDFNSKPSTVAYRELTEGGGFRLKNTFDLAANFEVLQPDGAAPVTYPPEDRIDHLFVEGAVWSVGAWQVDLFSYGPNDRYPSDHFAMSARLDWLVE